MPAKSHIIKIVYLLLFGIFFYQTLTKPTFAAPAISLIQSNSSSIPKFDKLELTFQVNNTTASNNFFPFDPNPPAGVPVSTGITVNAQFLPPGESDWNTKAFLQPAFYFQEFLDQTLGNKEWFYPTSNFSWRVRFSPNQTGIWQFRLTATDAGGTATTNPQSFTVTSSAGHGFIKVSPTDSRYFEFDDGTYFPALGFNLNGGDLDNANPVLGNTSEFQNMGPNGIELSRVWVSQFSIYGESWNKWVSNNRFHNIVQEQRSGIINPLNPELANNYPGLVAPTPPAGSEYYLWLEYNTFLDTSTNLQPRFTPCRYVSNTPVKKNTQYRVKVRYQDLNLEGPKSASFPNFGFAVKTTSEFWGSLPDRCNDHDAGTIVAATYNATQVSNDTANPGWKFLQGSFTSNSTDDFLPYIYLTFDNVASQDLDTKAGHVFIDKVWLEESSCTSNCANLLSKPWMSPHLYFNQRDAYSFDKVLNLAEQYGLYLKAVMHEKNDRIFQTIGFNGLPASSQSVDNFHGNGRIVTKVRWLHQAWWRYMQARWGYSPYIHSWELLNEGNTSSNHLLQSDEFGKYMKCRVFGQEPATNENPNGICLFDHPNSHLTSTSFSGGAYPWQFWNNGGSAAQYKLYRDVDYADQHLYAHDSGPEYTSSFYDSAQFTNDLSTNPGLWAPPSANTRKPFIRGEVAWSFTGTNQFEINAEGGEWLHDFVWAGINHGALLEHFFAGGNFTKQLYNLSANPPYDHRPIFKTYYNFIKDIPLNNGNYQDASASASISQIRAWGQKDLVNKRAHLWIANKNHTWYNVMGGYTTTVTPTPPPVAPVGSVSGDITIPGFTPNTTYPIQWWNTYTGLPDPSVGNPDVNITANGSGVLTLSVSNLVSDAAVRIGNYTAQSTPTPSPTPDSDFDNDGDVDINDYNSLLNQFDKTNCSFNILGDCRINIFDYNYLVSLL